MKSRACCGFVLLMVVAAMLPARAQPGADTRASTTCNSCADCNDKLGSGAYDTVTLVADIVNDYGDCITRLASGTVFDCNGHSIDGDDISGDPIDQYWDSGFDLWGLVGSTIQNCVVTDYDHGILLGQSATDVALLNNTVNSNLWAIVLEGSTGTEMRRNTLQDNKTGIILSEGVQSELGARDTVIAENTVEANERGIALFLADDTTMTSNVACDNTEYDIALYSGARNTGDENTCATASGWNDSGTTGCTYMCEGAVGCASCADCNAKLDGRFSTVVLTQDISDHVGSCIEFSAGSVTFDCNGHAIDGDDAGTDYGIRSVGRSQNAVRDCRVSDFSYGLYLDGVEDMVVESCTLDSNTDFGMYAAGVSYSSFNDNAATASQIGLVLEQSSLNTLQDNRADGNSGAGLWLGDSASNRLQGNTADDNGLWGIMLASSPANTLINNSAIGNPIGVRLAAADDNVLQANRACSDPGPDIAADAYSTGNQGDYNTCDAADGWNDVGTVGCTYACDSNRVATCSDGRQNGNEVRVDCGGTYCPPCSQCVTGAQYSPSDTACQHAWPTSDGPDIGMNTTSDSCNLVEVCAPGLDYVIRDALNCCEHEQWSEHLSEPWLDRKTYTCAYAQQQAYDGNFRGRFDALTLKECLGHYLIGGLGWGAIYMQNYFDGEWSCYGDRTAHACQEWRVDPPAWEMGTAASCAGDGGLTPDFQMGGHRCEYYWIWLFTEIRWGKDGWWDSDTDWKSNNDSAADIPAHASIDRLSTGTCTDYAFALSTLLRKAGYSKDEVFAVQGEGHGYNLVRFPTESRWHYVDTVGNTGGGVWGGPGFPTPSTADYNYCVKLDGGCSNDVYSQSESRCPTNDMIYGCEDIQRAARAPVPGNVRLGSAPRLASLHAGQAPEDCTELYPCETSELVEASPPAAPVQLQVDKEHTGQALLVGQPFEVVLSVINEEAETVHVTVRETFAPGFDYALEAQDGAYQGYPYKFHEWSLDAPPYTPQEIAFTVTPNMLGVLSLLPTTVAADGSAYQVSSSAVTVVCASNGSCDPGENYLLCPEDCDTGIVDGTCDGAADGINDPDCAYGADPDFDPGQDTDGDGIQDGSDACPLTAAGASRDEQGCSCAQKACEDGDPATVDICVPSMASCLHLPDGDQDGVATSADNCPTVYNPTQTDSDGNGTGDQCEIGDIVADTTLTAGTYYVSDLDGNGAIEFKASDVALDCNGATLIGSGSGYGIRVPPEVNGVTIKNCTAEGYRYGIFLDGSRGDALLDNSLAGNGYGLVLGATTASTIRHNVMSANTYAGVYLEGASQNQILDNTVNANASLGFFLHTSTDNDLSDNVVCFNADADLALRDAVNAGDGNTCDEPGEWNDTGTQGCTNPCLPRLYLPLVMHRGSG